MKVETRASIIFILLAALFFVNIPPPEDMNIQDSGQVQETPVNFSPYIIQVNETEHVRDFEGNIIENITRAVNKTIYPEQPKEEKETNILVTLSNLGSMISPSQPMLGWVILALLTYFVIFPILRWIKELIWGG